MKNHNISFTKLIIIVFMFFLFFQSTKGQYKLLIENRHELKDAIKRLIDIPQSRVIRTNDKLIIVLHLDFDTNESEIPFYNFDTLDSYFNKYYTNQDTLSNKIEKIEIFGHSDLQHFSQDNIKRNENLANMRSKEVLAYLKGFMAINKNIIPDNVQRIIGNLGADYHNHFFLDCCDSILGDTLLTYLDYKKNVNALSTFLNVPTEISSYEINCFRENKDIQKKITSNLFYCRRGFRFFRAVIIFTYYSV